LTAETGRGPDQEITTLITRARRAVDVWEEEQLWQLDEECDRQALAEALVEKLIKLANHPRATKVLVEWILDHDEVVDLFADDAQVERALRELVVGSST
jgi:hypothetical protein